MARWTASSCRAARFGTCAREIATDEVAIAYPDANPVSRVHVENPAISTPRQARHPAGESRIPLLCVGVAHIDAQEYALHS